MKYLLKKVFTLIITLFIVSLLAFLAFQVISDPATAILGTSATPESLAALREEMGLNRPIFVQYGSWLLGFLQGDFGTSYSYHIPVAEMIAQKLPITAMLTLFSFKGGLGGHRYSVEDGKVTTATEYNGSRQDLVASANKNQIPIEGALIAIIRAILWAAKDLQKAAVVPDTPISVNWDDSYITDAETRMTQMRDDALSGLLPRYKYLSARYGISEEDARRLAQEAAAENRQPELTFGGGA